MIPINKLTGSLNSFNTLGHPPTNRQNFMSSILIPGLLLLIALIMVSLINQAQERRRIRRARQRRLRHQITNLEEVITALEQTLPNRLIAKHVNDEILDLLQTMLALEQGNTELLETSLRNVEARGEELTGARNRAQTRFQKDSDVQIAQSQLYINEAGKVLRHRFNQGRLPPEELEIYLADLTWAHLMVSVISLIGQGHKATARGDVFSSHAFYQKAQHLLMESSHPEPKRMRMIKEMGELLAGNRQALSQDLMQAEKSWS